MNHDEGFYVEENGNVVDLEVARVEHENDASELEDALETVADAVVTSWEVFGSDVHQSVVTEVDGQMVRLSVSVELVD